MARKILRKLRKAVIPFSLATGALLFYAVFYGSRRVSTHNQAVNNTQIRQVVSQPSPKSLECLTGEGVPQSRLDSFFHDFPEKIPGARSVDKYFVPGSRYCIVHVRQMHEKIGVPFEELHYKRREEILSVQKDIEDSLSYLITQCHVEQVYSAGRVELEDTATRRVIIEKERKNLASLEKSGRASPKLISEKKDAIREAELSVRLGYWPPPEGNSIYAVSRLAARGRITLIPFDSWANAKKMLSGASSHEFLQASLAEEREDYFMQKIPKRRDYFAFVVLGGAHCFGGKTSCGASYPADSPIRANDQDNLYFWNKEHHNQKMSLIEITPASYPKED